LKAKQRGTTDRSGSGDAVRPVLTGRALALGAVVLLLVVLLAAPINRYLTSRREISRAAQQLRDDRQQLGDLARQKARWSDPGYIQRQARIRLQYAMPGDTVYVVVNKGQRSDIEKTSGTDLAGPAGPGWNTRLMDSVRAAAG
jgi:cell division protein FtsB